MTPIRLLPRLAGMLALLSLLSLPLAACSGTDDAASEGEQPAEAQSAQPVASPRDSLAVDIAGAAIAVNYGRPSKRGREIFNGLSDMKWGMVWRTGANEATQFTTSKTLSFGDKTVPAGAYTLFTQLQEDLHWELVVSKQTGQWGTEYDPAQDLVRIPMTVTNGNPVVEKMEIQVNPVGAGGEIVVMWDTYKAVASFTVQ